LFHLNSSRLDVERQLSELSRQPNTGKAVSKALKLANVKIVADYLSNSEQKFPWWDPHGDLEGYRRFIADWIFWSFFENVMTAIIVCNLVIVVYQTDQEAKCYPDYELDFKSCPHSGEQIMWLKGMNLALLMLYSVEALMKIIVAQLDFFKRADNLLDLTICVMGFLAEILQDLIQVGWLRVFRLWRLVRVLNSASRFPEIHMFVAGLGGAIRAMFFGMLLLVLALLFCSILVVQFIHPISIHIDYGNCERCRRGFKTVMESMLTLFQQIVAGDSWGQISIPVIEHSPGHGMLLPVVQLLVAMGIMNLILAVVVDRSVDAREQNKERLLEEKRSQTETRRLKLLTIIGEFDVDESGTLSRQEIEAAFHDSAEIKLILSMANIGKADLNVILDALEAESDMGEVSYERLCTVIHEIECIDLRKLGVVSHLSRKTKEIINENVLATHSKMLERLTYACEHLMVGNFIRLEKKIDALTIMVSEQDPLPERVPLTGTDPSLAGKSSPPAATTSTLATLSEVCELPLDWAVSSAADAQMPQDFLAEVLRENGDTSGSHQLLTEVLKAHDRLLLDLKSSAVQLSEQQRTCQHQQDARLLQHWHNNRSETTTNHGNVPDGRAETTRERRISPCPLTSKTRLGSHTTDHIDLDDVAGVNEGSWHVEAI